MQVEGKRHWSLLRWSSTGARVSNAYPTCLWPRDNPSKVGLIPYAVVGSHLMTTKDFIGERWGCVWLACWRGNSPPRRRSVAGLRGWTATLGLRHGPNSYGRQQWYISWVRTGMAEFHRLLCRRSRKSFNPWMLRHLLGLLFGKQYVFL